MQNFSRIIIILFFSIVACLSAHAVPYQNFSESYFFGDSLTDQGNFNGNLLSNLITTSTAISPISGSVWTTTFAKNIGTNSNIRGVNYYLSGFTTTPIALPTNSPDNSTNYAVAGNTSSSILFQLMTNFLDKKVLSNAQYISIGTKFTTGTATNNSNLIDQGKDELTKNILESSTRLDSNAFYTFWVGGNDYITEQNATVKAANRNNPQLVVSRILNSVNLLRAAGAKNIAIFNLPDFSTSNGAIKLLYGILTNNLITDQNKKDAQKISTTHNAELLKRAREANYPILFVDIETLFNNVRNNYDQFGFANQSDVLLSSDEFHPSARSHTILGQMLSLNHLSPIKTVNSMYTTTSDIIKNINQGILQQAENYLDSSSKTEAFMFGQLGYKKSARIADNRAKSIPSNISIGVKHIVNSNLAFGLAFSQHQQHVKKLNENSSFWTTGQTFSGFIGYQNNLMFLTTILQVGRESFKDIERRFKLSEADILMRGKTTGRYFSSVIQTGIIFIIKKFRISPYLELQNSQMRISPYTESESTGKITALSLDIHRQKTHMALGGIGTKIVYQLQYGMANYFINANLANFFTLDRHVTSVDYNPSTASGTRASFDINPNEAFFKFETSISYAPIRKNAMNFSAGYTLVKGTRGTHRNYATLSANLPIG